MGQIQNPTAILHAVVYSNDSTTYVPKNSNDEEMEKIKISIEERMNFVQESSLSWFKKI